MQYLMNFTVLVWDISVTALEVIYSFLTLFFKGIFVCGINFVTPTIVNTYVYNVIVGKCELNLNYNFSSVGVMWYQINCSLLDISDCFSGNSFNLLVVSKCSIV